MILAIHVICKIPIVEFQCFVGQVFVIANIYGVERLTTATIQSLTPDKDHT